MTRRAAVLATTTLLLATTVVAGCGSSGKHGGNGVAIAALRTCLRSHGYSVEQETAQDVGTAPSRFEFVTIWNLVNPNNRVALALTISRSTVGAAQAAAWTRTENKKIGKGVVKAPVVRFGRIDVLWTAEPGALDVRDIYGCVRPRAS